ETHSGHHLHRVPAEHERAGEAQQDEAGSPTAPNPAIEHSLDMSTDRHPQREEKHRSSQDVSVLPERLPRPRFRPEVSLPGAEVAHPGVDPPGEDPEREPEPE